MDYELEIVQRGEIPGGYRFKVSVLNLGLFMDGFTARKSTKSKSGWWVQPPAKKIGVGKYVQCPEFDKSMPLWKEIEASIISQLNDAPSETYIAFPSEDELTDAAISDSLDEAVKKFGLESIND